MSDPLPAGGKRVQDPTDDAGRLRGDLLLLHRAVIQGEPGASSNLAEALLPVLTARLRHLCPLAESEFISQAVDDAVLWYLCHPDRYEPNLARLDVFLGHVAHRRLLDEFRRRARVRRIETGVDDVALEVLANRQNVSKFDTADSGGPSARDRVLAFAKTAAEHAFLKAKLTGASRFQLALILGVECQPAAEQLKAIQRTIKRIHQRALRSRSDGKVRSKDVCVKLSSAGE